MILIATAPVSRRGNTLVARRSYQYDTLGRPTSRTLARQGATRNDVFTYNDRSELISDVVDGTGLNGWDYDNIGNRLVQQQGSACDTYTSNQLNQYTAIEDESHDVFTPAYDEDGNQARIKTSTGIWDVTYNAKNRPVLFSKEGENLTVACTYDYMGRRVTKVVTENGVITTSHRFLYRGYLQIDSPPPHRRLTPAGQHRFAGCPPGLTAVGRVACCDRKRANHPCLWLITWDPTQDVATRPLAIQKDGTWYTYGWDLTKNIWEAYNTSGYIGTAYSYTAYGQVTASGSITQPIQWSSEYNDTELGLVYYNYRHYNPVDGRWIERDPFWRREGMNLYVFCVQKPSMKFDYLGLCSWSQNQPDVSISSVSELNPEEYAVEKDENTECGKTKNEALKNEKVVKYIAEMKAKKCKIPTVVCACCLHSSSAAGWAIPTSSEKSYSSSYKDKSKRTPYIVICKRKGISLNEMVEYLMHELTHHLQYCQNRPWKSCDDYYINEVEAYTKQGLKIEDALERAKASVRLVEKCPNTYSPSEKIRQDYINKFSPEQSKSKS